MTERILLIEEVLDDLTGLIDLTPLVEAVKEADVDVGMLTDEEVHWIGPDPDRKPEEFIDAPRLSQLTSDHQEIALETALWMLQARGDATYDPTTDTLRLEGVHAILADLRNRPEAAVSVRVDVRGEGMRRAAIYRVRPDLFLSEEVSDSGLHHFVLRSPVRQAAWLAAAIDPHHHVTTDSSSPQTASSLEGLDPNPDELAQRCDSAAFVFYGERGPDGQSSQRAFTAYSSTGGVHILTGRESANRGSASLQRLGRGDLLGFCAAFLAGTADQPPTG